MASSSGGSAPNLSPAHVESLSRQEGAKSVQSAMNAVVGAAQGAAWSAATGGSIGGGALGGAVFSGAAALGHADAAQELSKQADISRMCNNPNDPMERIQAAAKYNAVFDNGP
eukprot:gb/GEZN01014850.1/.p2 GENE.gb/GEZN01014850.1/~~gb/GEZN01014850.1/.p2  ORF type:complete len:113 (+),score=17.46 gb/GEZN01014850.1/:192-530(+)